MPFSPALMTHVDQEHDGQTDQMELLLQDILESERKGHAAAKQDLLQQLASSQQQVATLQAGIAALQQGEGADCILQ